MRVLETKCFARYARSERIEDVRLRKAVMLGSASGTLSVATNLQIVEQSTRSAGPSREGLIFLAMYGELPYMMAESEV